MEIMKVSSFYIKGLSFELGQKIRRDKVTFEIVGVVLCPKDTAPRLIYIKDKTGDVFSYTYAQFRALVFANRITK